MKIIHLRGFSEQERTALKEVVYSNVVVGMKAICGAMTKLGLEV